ncbi:hypothetical protein RND71_037724 [Anisodus tanguticus]|uniref:pectinesterase n=1 Tax=Anisodus tanguticus TaxID=243964 RepID=A0AAE1QYL2_9SOLA|nr:hypothetical protein RND71_037724 [Anisodus tanguticus]
MQAVALRLTGDRAVLYRVRILSSQDTLLDDAGSHYFYQCYIQGSVDFICGNGRSLYKGLGRIFNIQELYSPNVILMVLLIPKVGLTGTNHLGASMQCLENTSVRAMEQIEQVECNGPRLNDSEAEPFLDVKFIGGQQWLRL